MGVDGVSQSPPALGLGDPTWILVIQSFNSHFLTPAGSSEGQLGQGAREQVGSCTLHPPYFLLLSPPAFALAVPSAQHEIQLWPSREMYLDLAYKIRSLPKSLLTW